jgi:hypothetical protein
VYFIGHLDVSDINKDKERNRPAINSFHMVLCLSFLHVSSTSVCCGHTKKFFSIVIGCIFRGKHIYGGGLCDRHPFLRTGGCHPITEKDS